MAGSRSTRVTSTLGRVLQDLAHRQAVAAAEDQDAPAAGAAAHGGVHERLVVAVLVGRGELEVAVEEELEARPGRG